MASMGVLWAVFTPAVLSWAAFVGVSVLGFLVLSGVLTIAMRSPQTVWQVIADTESESRGVAGLRRVAIPATMPINQLKGDRPQ
jgi:hypothetical protein